MEPEEIQTRIEAEETQMNKLIKEKNRIEKKKVATDNQKKKELEPIELELTNIRKKIMLLLEIKNALIPAEQKLPKDHQYFKHYQQTCKFKKQKPALENVRTNLLEYFEEKFLKMETVLWYSNINRNTKYSNLNAH